MGIILKNKKHNHIIFYSKGAENVMTKFVKKEYMDILKKTRKTWQLKA